jgi:hypothetical protein
LRLHPRDDVAVALQALSPGLECSVAASGDAQVLRVAEHVPSYHKIALRDLPADPGSDLVFARAWAEAPEDFRSYKGLAAVTPGVEAFLADCAAPRPQTVMEFREESPS